MHTERPHSLRRACGVTLLLLTAVFTALYWDFLRGIYLYAYEDIGSDTVTQYLPKIVFDINSIRSGTVGQYRLDCGLGCYFGGTFYSYLNPLNLPLVLFGEAHLAWGLLVSLYLKYTCIALAALLFFRRLLKDSRLAVLCALLWTFSGYLALWGQHYQFLTAMAGFTLAMYGVQLFLEGDRKAVLLPPALAALAGTSYYFLYISCFLFAVYSIVYLRCSGAGAREILKKAGWFALAMLLAVGIAGVYMLPAVTGFLESTRGADVTGKNSAVAPLYSLDYILAFLGRFFSNNALGAGDSYQGPTNYYEVAMLSVSVLAVFSLVLLCQSRFRKRTAGIASGCAVLLCLPAASQLLGFAVDKLRWTYLLCFAEVILIGFGLKYLFAHREQEGFGRTIRRTVLISDGGGLLCIGLLWVTRGITGNGFCGRAYACALVFMAAYSVFLLLTPRWNARRSYVLLAALIAAELAAANYATVNDRGRTEMADWQESMYYDGTEEALQWILEQDDSLCRVNKTYNSVMYNDAMIQSYAGLGVYNSTNSAVLSRLYTEFGYSLIYGYASNWVRFSGIDGVESAYLGAKYVLTLPETVMDERFYRKVYATERCVVYKTRCDLGFGYVYQEEIGQSQVSAMSKLQRELALSKYYYVTDGAGENPDCRVNTSDTATTVDLRPFYTQSVNCSVTGSGGLEVAGTGDDMQLYFACPEIPEGWVVSGVNVTMTAERDAAVQLMLATEQFDATERYCDTVYYKAGTGTYRLDAVSWCGTRGVRLDLSDVCQNISVESVELVMQDAAQLTENLAALGQNRMTDLTQEGDTFRGTVASRADGAMLCVPLVYNEHWQAAVDGAPAEVTNINGGLVGIRLDAGDHEITLTYVDRTRQWGWRLTVVSLAVYLLALLGWSKRKRTK